MVHASAGSMQEMDGFRRFHHAHISLSVHHSRLVLPADVLYCSSSAVAAAPSPPPLPPLFLFLTLLDTATPLSPPSFSGQSLFMTYFC